MLENAKYSVWFRTPQGEGYGIVSLMDGIVSGGDSISKYTGAYVQEGDKFSATIAVRRHTQGPQVSAPIVNFTRLKLYRQLNPDFNQFVVSAMADHNSKGQLRRWRRIKNDAVRTQNNDYFKIRAMLPANFPDRDDVVSNIFVSPRNRLPSGRRRSTSNSPSCARRWRGASGTGACP
jgi:hypothetical protein